jgi:hypothetical protein
MGSWNQVNRPVTLAELALSFESSASRIDGLIRRHRIAPAVRIGRTRLYGPDQVRLIYGLLRK